MGKHRTDLCKCGQIKDARSKQCQQCHLTAIAPAGYAATAKIYGPKWAVRHMQTTRLSKPSDLERLVKASLDRLGVYYEREYWLQTKATGRRAKVYLLDFMVMDEQTSGGYMAIEIDGAYAHERHAKRDKAKKSLCKRRGIALLTLTDGDIKAPRAALRAEYAAKLDQKIIFFLGLACPTPETALQY